MAFLFICKIYKPPILTHGKLPFRFSPVFEKGMQWLKLELLANLIFGREKLLTHKGGP